MFAGQLVRMLTQLGGIAILARFLGPADFGVYDMVATVVVFASLFKDAGLTVAIVQAPAVSAAQLSTMFWCLAGVGAALSVAVFAAAPLVAAFFGEPQLLAITRTVAWAFVLSSLGAVHVARLQRDMLFKRMALHNCLAPAIGVSVAVCLAWQQAGVWALAWQVVAVGAAEALLAWALYPWMPGPPVRNSGVRKFLHFGGNVFGFNLVNYFSRNLDKILIGRFISAEMLGYYTKSHQFVAFPLVQLRGPLQAVGIPVLSRTREAPEQFQRFYCRLLGLLALVLSPLLAYFVLYAETIVTLVLGEQWLPSAALFRIIAVAGWIQTLASTRGMVMVACGFGRRYLMMGLMLAALTTTGYCIGLAWGILGVAWAHLIAHYGSFPFLQWWCFRGTPVTMRMFVRAILYPFVASLAMVATCLLAAPLIEMIPWIAARAATGGLLGIAAYVAALLSIAPARADARVAYAYLLEIIGPAIEAKQR